jgi:exodeoxyribonuclease V alpha subunit
MMNGKSATADTPSERLSGSVERVTFHSEESGYCVLRVKTKGKKDLVTVLGSAATIRAGEYIEGLGTWINDRNYGLQFKTTTLRTVPPDTVEGIEKYLGSGMVKGIGPHFAKTLVKKFQTDVFDIIENSPERLKELPGIGPKRIENITTAWKDQKSIREIMVFLQSHGVGTSRAVRIYKTHGDEAIIKVSENPYRLALDITGIGFKTADAIAIKLGIPQDSLIRAQAGVRHVLQEISGEGHCASAIENLVTKSTALLELSDDLVREAIDAEIDDKNLVAEGIDGKPCVFLTPLHRAEVGVAASIKRLLTGTPSWAGINPETAIPWVESKTGLTLSASQKEAVNLALRSKLLIITRGPGTGKTTLVNSILKILAAKQLNILLAAPTGRAAKRMTETTGLPAKTIHRLLEFDGKNGGFKRTRENPLEANLVVIDETSMVDVVLANKQFSAIPDDVGVLLVGDVDQLPSVGPGMILSDLIASGVVPVVRLTEIFRQAATSKIITSAHRINQGLLPEKTVPGETTDFYFMAAETPEEIHEKLLTVILDRIPKRFGFDPMADIQLLTPMNRGGLGVTALNEIIQQKLNPEPAGSLPRPKVKRFGTTFAEGDRVIQTENDYDKDVFNGDMGRILRIDEGEGALWVEFDGREVEYLFGELDELALAYAVSIHKKSGQRVSLCRDSPGDATLHAPAAEPYLYRSHSREETGHHHRPVQSVGHGGKE